MRSLQIVQAAAGDRDRVNRVLGTAYSRSNGTLDRSAEPQPFPPRDVDGLPVTYFLATLEGEDRGVAGVSVHGEILDWAIAPGSGAGELARALEAFVESFARNSGAEELNVLVAGDDTVSIRALLARGYYEVPAPITVMSVVHFPRFVASILASRKTDGLSPMSVRIDLDPGLYPQLLDREITIAVRDGTARIEERARGPVDVSVRTTATDFSELLLGSLTPFGFARRAAIWPWYKWGTAHRLFRLLAPDRGWYSPLGERR